MNKALVLLLLTVGLAWAGRRKPPPEPTGPEPAPAPQHAPKAEPWTQPLFPPEVVVDPGPVPAGLAHVGRQACAACHPSSHDAWRAGPHARPPSARLTEASAGLAGCDVCHRPLLPQRETVDTVWDGRLDQVTRAPNPAFDAGAWSEGVTCAACHVRGGAVLTATADHATRPSPHPLRFAPELAEGRVCAACHQLGLPGLATPLYDTWGEWERSGFAAAGVTCLTCHGRAGAEPSFVSHDPARPLEHGLSVGLTVQALRVIRGAPAVRATVWMQNTGAGHAVPTGSPWRRLELRAHLEGPPDKAGARPVRGEVVEVLAREIASTPPFAVGKDTRLLPGERREVPFDLALPTDVPAAGWELVVTVGAPGEAEFDRRIVRRWPLAVE